LFPSRKNKGHCTEILQGSTGIPQSPEPEQQIMPTPKTGTRKSGFQAALRFLNVLMRARNIHNSPISNTENNAKAFLLSHQIKEIDMANVQVKVDDWLRTEAQSVANSMGIDLASAVCLFLTQMVREKGLPFRPTADPFYSPENQEVLKKSIKQLDAGQTVTKNLAELESME
jgi:DNA-damage-inducible protein J